jgi:cobyrinic acid a,c-diamide synthase
MKGIMIVAPSSGGGKTTVTIGIIRALLNMGLNVCGFKTGPDYIDTSFIGQASKKKAGNLDTFLQGRDGVKSSISMGEGEYCIIEGAMGYYDGLYNTFEDSSYDISKLLNVNSILVYTPSGEMFSAIPKIKGMVDFGGSSIVGVILNKVSKRIYDMMKSQIEEYTGIPVLGYIPDIPGAAIESRHLGLIQCSEIDDIEQKIEKIASVVREHIDLKLLIQLMKNIHGVPSGHMKKRNITAAVAYDKAFSFYYRENLRMLEKSCNVEYFSPLEDKSPPECDLLYIGGGYPEVFAHELAGNKDMLSAIKSYADSGGCLYGECGGFMYLTDSIEDSLMVGIFKGSSSLTKRLQRFGYIEIILKCDCMLGKRGDRLSAHEFHKSVAQVEGPAMFSIKKAMGDKTWECGYSYKNVLAGYPHINFLGNKKAFSSMLDYAENHRREKAYVHK